MRWFVLFVKAGKEYRVSGDFMQAAAKFNLAEPLTVFCPESEVYYRSKAKRTVGKPYLKRPLFPGYVFVETDVPPEEFVATFGAYIYNSPDIIRLLKDGSGNIALPRDEQARFEYLFCGKRCIEHSEGYIEGDKIIVTAGPLRDREGLITHINRHNRLAVVRFTMFGKAVEIQLALEIVRKTV